MRALQLVAILGQEEAGDPDFRPSDLLPPGARARSAGMTPAPAKLRAAAPAAGPGAGAGAGSHSRYRGVVYHKSNGGRCAAPTCQGPPWPQP